MRTLFFAINFTMGVLFTVGCGVMLWRGNNLVAFIAGVFVLPMGVALTAAEWVAWRRERRDLEKRLAVWCLVLAGFGAFGVVSNASTVLQEGLSRELGVALPVGLAITIYFGICGAWRLRAASEPEG